MIKSKIKIITETEYHNDFYVLKATFVVYGICNQRVYQFDIKNNKDRRFIKEHKNGSIRL